MFRSMIAAILLTVAMPSIVSAQGFPTAGERKAADVASWLTVGAALTLDVSAHCTDTWDACHDALVLSAVRIGVTVGATALIKHIVHRDRPCASFTPACTPGNDSFYSMHTALAFSSLGGPRIAIAIPLAVSTGGLRVAAGKHWWTDVLVGAGVGALTSRIR